MRELSIICYHGVVDKIPKSFNSSGKHLNLEIFQKQINFLASNFEIVTMRDVENFFHSRKDLPKKSIAITFDDGYANNLKYAHGILENLSVPATIYLSTGYIGMNRLIWSDEVELAVLSLPFEKFKIKLDQEILFDSSTVEKRIVALNQIKKVLKKSPPKVIASVISELTVHNKNYRARVTPDLHSFLDWDEVRFMKSSKIWEIGAHTVDHYSLGTVSSRVGIAQIKDSIFKLSQEVETSDLPLFSYPEGQNFDIPSYAVDCLNSLGIKSSPSAIAGKNMISRFRTKRAMFLKRYLVGFENLDFPWKL
jgi:peptidoglycan/xylan/chitin deacetylase (PgdA/CDA1 family)